MLNRDHAAVYGEDHVQFRDMVRRFLAVEFTPCLELTVVRTFGTDVCVN